MLDPHELAEVAAAFGVADEQVRRDHLISHILAAIADLAPAITFFGGTALSRTHLSDPDVGARLSEDIDLYTPQRRATAAILDERLPQQLRREFPGTRWDPTLSAVRSTEPGQLVTRDGLRVRIQLLDSSGEHHDLGQWGGQGSHAPVPGPARYGEAVCADAGVVRCDEDDRVGRPPRRPRPVRPGRSRHSRGIDRRCRGSSPASDRLERDAAAAAGICRLELAHPTRPPDTQIAERRTVPRNRTERLRPGT